MIYQGIKSDSALRLEAAQTFAKHILKHSLSFDWSLQGMGMLRLHMDNFRLHVWDLRFAFSGVSFIHDHQQWGLQSLILSGEIRNIRYVENPHGERYMSVRLKAGYGCRFLAEPTEIRLVECAPEIYMPGESYSQELSEIHRTIPRNGTVTIMRKTSTPDGETARVFWKHDGQWGSAEPRKATADEIMAMTSYALSVWGKS